MKTFWIAAVLVAVMSGAARGERAAFYVATNGDDSLTGTAAEVGADGAGPFATLARAQRAVRELKNAQPNRDKPIVVAIRGGMYELAAPITFTPADAGADGAPIIYEAFEGERPIFSAGRRIRDWKIGDDGRWRLTLEEVARGEWNFAQLFVDDQRRFRPRVPQQGYMHIVAGMEATEANREKGYDRFIFAPGDLRGDWHNLNDVEVYAIHLWAGSRLRISDVDETNQIVTFTGPTSARVHWASFEKGRRYFAENVREALDAPGEWYLDRSNGELTYIPREGERPEDAAVIAPRLETALIFAGNIEEKQWVEHITLRGLTFAHSNWTTPPAGNAYPQAEVNQSGTIEMYGVRHIALERCAVRHTGNYAVSLGIASQHVRIDRCELVDLGAGGVMIGSRAGRAGQGNFGIPAPRDPDLQIHHNIVRHCLIAHGGRMHPAAIGVWIGNAAHNTIEHNDIFDFYYTGVSVGWVWGYGESLAHHNEIAHNHIHHIGQRVLTDMGGVYTLGVSPGTIVHGNRIHDVYSYDYGGWGLYTDEGSTGIVMRDNLVYRTRTGSFHQHYGRENRIENNILAFSELHQVQRTRNEAHTSFIFARNIVYWDNSSPLLASNWEGGPENRFVLDHNVYWHVGDDVTFPGGRTLDDWRRDTKQDAHSIIADPLFVDVANDDFRLRDDSPALKLGFKPFDWSQAGRHAPAELTADLPPVPAGFE